MIAIHVGAHDGAVQQRIFGRKQRGFLRVGVAVAVIIVVAGVAKRVGARAVPCGVTAVGVRLAGLAVAGQLSVASGTPSLSASPGGATVTQFENSELSSATVRVATAVMTWPAVSACG